MEACPVLTVLRRMLSPFSMEASYVNFLFFQFLPARRCASALVAMTLCLSVRLSVRLSVARRMNKSSWFLAWGLPMTFQPTPW